MNEEQLNKEFDEALERLLDAYYCKGKLAEADFQFGEAREFYKKALSLDETHVKCCQALRELNTSMGIEDEDSKQEPGSP